MNKEWLIELDRKDFYDRVHLMTIANGYMGVKGYFPEMFEKKDSSILVIGIYDQVGEKWKEIVNQPNYWHCEFKVDGEKVELKDENTESFSVYLDMYTSKITLSYIWRSERGKRLEVKHERIICHDRRNTAAWKMSIKSLGGSVDLALTLGIDADVYDANGPHLQGFSAGELAKGFFLNCQTQQHKYQITVSNHIALTADGKEIERGEIKKEEKTITAEYKFKLADGKAAALENIGYLFTSRDSQEPLEDAVEAAKQEIMFADMYKTHSTAIKEQWNLADIIIDGDEKDQKYMRFNLHILLTSVPKDYDYGFTPSRMLSAQTYKGAIFWEVDTYAFPFLAYVFPQYAKNHLVYRYNCLAHEPPEHGKDVNDYLKTVLKIRQQWER